MSTYSPSVQDADAPLTTHVEPLAQGGRRYLRCESCNREVLGTDPERLPHRDDCRGA